MNFHQGVLFLIAVAIVEPASVPYGIGGALIGVAWAALTMGRGR